MRRSAEVRTCRFLQMGIAVSTIVLLASAVFASEGRLPAWTERIHLSGTLEADFSWTDHGDMERGSGSSSELSIGTVELGVSIELTDWIIGDIVLLAEDLGTDDETGVEVDEATMTFEKEEFPVFLVAGKRAQPFGVFENHLVTDPMTQDAYETNEVGVTLGCAAPMGLELTGTVYKGEEMMEHLFESGLFDGDTVERTGERDDDISSYVFAASIEPWEDHLVLFGAFISEPGSARNNTVNAGLNVVVGGLRIDGEYMKAIDRERYAGMEKKFREGVLSIGAAYDFIVRKREIIGGALFEERKAHVLAEPLEVAVRYEHFSDDGMADETRSWSVSDRYSAGARHAFFRHPRSGLVAFLAAEFRYTDYRLHRDLDNEMEDSTSEIFARLGITF